MKPYKPGAFTESLLKHNLIERVDADTFRTLTATPEQLQAVVDDMSEYGISEQGTLDMLTNLARGQVY